MKPQPPSLIGVLHQLACGVAIGGIDIVAGVSGGTVALVLGVYDRLVIAISHFDAAWLVLIWRRDWSAAARHVDLRFLAPITCGIGLGVASMAGVMSYLLKDHQQPTLAAFFGLIVASSVLVAQRVGQWNELTVGCLVLGTVFAFVVVGLPVREPGPTSHVFLFICGMLAICAMILPGISGAHLLMALGQYGAMLGYLVNLTHGDLSAATVVPVCVFVAGCVVGLRVFSPVMRWLLTTHRDSTMATLCGFMAGSLPRVWPFKQDLSPEVSDINQKRFANVWPNRPDELLTAIGLGLGAAALLLLLDRLARRSQRSSEPPADSVG